MTQSRKDGENHIRYYYCRSFGPVPACRSPGLLLTSKEWHRLHERIENGIDVWRFDAEENRYIFERDMKTIGDLS